MELELGVPVVGLGVGAALPVGAVEGLTVGAVEGCLLVLGAVEGLTVGSVEGTILELGFMELDGNSVGLPLLLG